MSKKSSKSGLEGGRFVLISPSTIPRRALEEDDEEFMDRSLKEAGLYEYGMSPKDKKDLMKALKDSKKHAEEEEERRQWQRHKSHLNYPSKALSSLSESAVADENVSSPSESSYPSADQLECPSPSSKSAPSPSTYISEDESHDSGNSTDAFSKLKDLSVSLVRLEEEMPIQFSSLQKSTTPPSNPAISEEIKTDQETLSKQSLLDVNSNSSQENVSGWPEGCRQESIRCAQDEDDGEETGNSISGFCQSAKTFLSGRTQNDDVLKSGQFSDSEDSNNRSVSKDPISPNQEEDFSSTVDVSSTGVTNVPVFKTPHGNLIADVSPLQEVIKKKSVESYPPHLRGLEKFKGDKTRWLSEARKATAALRVAYWRDVLTKNPKWKDSVTETGSNLKTLFKRPTYSGLFSDAGSFASKQHANSNLSDNVGNSPWHFASGGKSPQMRSEENSSMNFEEKTASKEYTRESALEEMVKRDSLNKMMDKSNISQSVWDDDGGAYRNLRSDKKVKYCETELDITSLPSGSGADPSVYDYDEKNDPDGDWQPAVNKSRRNSKKGPRSNGDQDFEPQGKPTQRGRGAAAKKSRGARVAKGALSRPSEHLHWSNNSDVRKSTDEMIDVQALDENQANDERSSWLSKDTVHVKDNVNIGTTSPAFHSLRKSRSMNRKQELGQARNSQRIIAQNNRTYENSDDTHVTERNVTCPICNGQFQEADIEAHASGCQEFQTAVEGDLQQVDMGSGGDNTEVAKNVVQSSTGAVPFSPSSFNSSSTEQCVLCLKLLTPAEQSTHRKECINENAIPSAPQKRASSDDEGPVRKTTRRLSLTKKP